MVGVWDLRRRVETTVRSAVYAAVRHRIEGLMERGSVLNFVQALVDYVDSSYGDVDHGREAARRGAAARHRQARGAPGDTRQARRAHPGGVGRGAPPPRRRRGHALPGPRSSRRGTSRAPAPRALRRHGLLPRPCRGGDLHRGTRGIGLRHLVAMRSDRPHLAAPTEAEAIAELRAVAGSQLDPSVVDALLSVLSHNADLAVPRLA